MSGDAYSKTLIKYRDLLCNLNKRNKEIYYKESNAAVPLTKLILPIDFKQRKIVLGNFSPASLQNPVFLEQIESGKINLSKHFLMKEEENKILGKRINRLKLIDDGHQKEFGISGGWFLGPFLIWRSKTLKNKDDILISPIFKLAIDIKKNKSKDEEAVFENETLTINPSLRLFLRRDLGVDLNEEYEGTLQEGLEHVQKALSEKMIDVGQLQDYPEVIRMLPTYIKDEDEEGNITKKKIDRDTYLNDVEKNVYSQVSQKKFLIHDLFYLDHISVNKMALFNDYEEILKDEPQETIKELVLAVPGNKTKDLRNDELDRLPESKNYFVVDIDSSQHLAIQKALHAKSLVIQGPPGTGKSQTITNMISQFMAEGKKVLFVSEKRAALDVVHSRLKKSNLAKQSVIIHSSDLDRKELYKSFIEILSEPPCSIIDSKWIRVSKDLDNSKEGLNSYFTALKMVHGPSGRSCSEIFALNARYSAIPLQPNLSKAFMELSYDELDNMKVRIDELEEYFAKFPNFFESVWYNKEKSFYLSEKNKHHFFSSYSEVVEVTCYLQGLITAFLSLFPGGDFSRLAEISSLEDSNFNTSVASAILNHFKANELSGQTLANVQENLLKIKESFTGYSMIREDANEEAVKSLSSYYLIPRGVFDWFTPTFWRMRKLMSHVVKTGYKLRGDVELQQWLRFRSESKQIDEVIGDLKHVCYIQTSSENFDSSHSSFYRNVVVARHLLESSKLIGGERLKEEMKSTDVTPLKKDLETARHLYLEFQEHFQKYNKLLSFFARVSGREILTDSAELDNNLTQIKSLHSEFSEVDKVHKFKDLIITFQSTYQVTDIEKHIATSLRQTHNWFDYIVAQCVKGWYDDILDKNSLLLGFDSQVFESKVSNIQELFQLHQRVACGSLNSVLATIKSSREIPLKAIKLLEAEANKQRRIKSPREVMESGALDAMLAIKRCWLMSPLSISQILPNIKSLFDVVIFDEASQVRIEDAIPSIYRAKNLVVVGDNKQMPPTNFFGSSNAEDEEEDEVELGESVLDQAIKAYEDIMLEWHYRSRSIALIAFSNYAFYDRKLIATPNPGSLVSGSAIKFHQVEDAYFSSKEGNRVEARLVAQEVARLLKDDKKASLGVISMGMAQQKAIEEEIELLLEEDKVFAEAYNFSLAYEDEGAFAGFFNKNLENVQGDERDCIIISIGYGRSKSTNKLRKAFGPLSTIGGGRRLNVAVTRAKMKMKVFCSFDISELVIDDATFEHNRESATFARFLHYAKYISDQDENGALRVLESFTKVNGRTSDAIMIFNSDLKIEIEKAGYPVVCNAGTCGFYVDLAVADPENPDTYLLGIECDGALLHVSDYSRDRDRARSFLLQSRGWELHRVWSQDWAKYRSAEISKILSKLEYLKGKKMNKVS